MSNRKLTNGQSSLSIVDPYYKLILGTMMRESKYWVR
jgi:hypothetical protein